MYGTMNQEKQACNGWCSAKKKVQSKGVSELQVQSSPVDADSGTMRWGKAKKKKEIARCQNPPRQPSSRPPKLI